MFGFFKRNRSNQKIIEEIYAVLVGRARDPVLFVEFGVEDSFEGRFETLTLFAVLLTRRLRAVEAPAPDLAQDVIDYVFAQFDRALREAGVGDITVPKRMKTMASAFMGRASAYDQALKSSEDGLLIDALLRNVYASKPDQSSQAKKLASYARSFDQALARTGIDTVMDAIQSAPSAASFK